MKKILFPTDFSSSAQHAFKYAIQFAQDYNAKIDVINIFNPTPLGTELGHVQMDEVIQRYQSLANEKLGNFVKDAPNGIVSGTTAIFGMFIPQEIGCYADEKTHDIIIMGTQGEHDMFEKLLGSITTYTMLRSPCPVLAIPKECTYASDFSTKSLLPVTSLRRISNELRAQLSLVHVVDHSDTPISEARRNLMLESVDDLTTHIIKNPSIEQGLDNFIQGEDVNWIAMFIPRRRLLERLFHQSFTKRMTFHSKTPVLVFHE